MSLRRPKYKQGHKPTRIKPSLTVPLAPTKFHKKIDEALTREERERAEAERKAKVHAEQLEREEANRKAKAERRTAHEAQSPQAHRHHYKHLVRVTEEGNRVVACKCGAYTLIEGTERFSG